MLTGIKNIIFDFGGVIINIDSKKTIQALKQLKLYNAEKLFTDVNTSNLLNKYELGIISDNEFLMYIKQYCSQNTTNNEIIRAWNSMLLDIPQNRIFLLNELKKDYKIYLLSNTNHIHYLSYTIDFEKATGGLKFNNFFDKAYFSFEIKMRKPSFEIYKHVLNEQKIKPEETLFIDDSLENIETAKMLNLKTHWLKEELVDILPITSLRQ